MQAIQDTEIYLDDAEMNEELVSASGGARRVLTLSLILFILLVATAIIFFVLMPMLQPAMPPLAPAVQI